MPLKNRNLRKSVMARARTLLQVPPAGSGGLAFTVYDEDSLVAVNKKTLTPVRPCVFLLDEYTPPTPPALPMVVVELVEVRARPFELGNRAGRVTEAVVHCFGRQRGEMEDLAAFFQDQFGPSFPIYTFTTSGSGVLLEQAEVDPDCSVEEMEIKSAARREGSLDRWAMVHLKFRTKA